MSEALNPKPCIRYLQLAKAAMTASVPPSQLTVASGTNCLALHLGIRAFNSQGLWDIHVAGVGVAELGLRVFAGPNIQSRSILCQSLQAPTSPEGLRSQNWQTLKLCGHKGLGSTGVQ